MTILPSTAAATTTSTAPNRHSLSSTAANIHRPNTASNPPTSGAALDGIKKSKSNQNRQSAVTSAPAVKSEPISASAPSTASAKNVPSSSSQPITIDGSEEDAMLAKSKFLTRMEVLRRRRRRHLQLAKIYRELYWLTMEEVKRLHRRFLWDFGKSPFQEDEEKEKPNLDQETAENGAAAITNAGGGGNGLGLGHQCSVYGCTTKAMALTKFCFLHILSDPKQKLYKPCSYAVRTAPTGPILCEKPILRSTVPSLCSSHLKYAEKLLNKALRKAGLNVNSNNKVAPKMHVLVAEFVRQIQSKRRAARSASKEIIEVKEESCF